MGSWTRLPAEIRLMILEIIAEDYRFKSEPYARAGYARVCREWQPIFEQRNFRRLVLDQERISCLEQFMGASHRQEYLEHLVLCVRLDEYDCTVCQSQEDRKTIRKNNNIISRAVWNLLIILSKWTGFALSCRPGRRQQGVTLELGVYSPGDCKHTFRDFHLDHDYPYQEKEDLEPYLDAYKQRADRLGLGSLDEPYHRWVNGHQDGLSLGSKQRIMGTLTIKSNLPEFSAFSQTFPKVEIITGLLIRRQFYRKIAVRSLSKLFRETFTCLRGFRHEGWHDVDPQQQLRFEKDYKNLLSWGLPRTLRELYIFEDFNMLHPERPTQRPNSSLGKALSKSSRFLENLSAAFLIDAEDFFAAFWPTRLRHNSLEQSSKAGADIAFIAPRDRA